MTRLRIPMVLVMGVLLVTSVTLLGWFVRDPLHAFTVEHPAFYPATVFGTGLLCLSLALVLVIESVGQKRAWLRRTAALVDLEGLSPPGMYQWTRRVIPDILETITQPLLTTSPGLRLKEEWADAGYGSRASRYLLFLLLFAIGGFVIGSRVGGTLLGAALFLITPLLPRALVRNRAERHRHLFAEQLPDVLDGLASGLSAGLSLQGAVVYVLGELSEPARPVFTKLSNRLTLGFPMQEALHRLQTEVNDEALSLAIDGMVLQRQFGGDMVQMLEETASLLRERVELEREVRAITTQGRLSGLIIAILVPVSAGFLLAFNPRYIDVLFDNVIGQALVISALMLQLIGWAIISRLVRIRY